MLLVAGPTPDMLRFIQVLGWIIMPALLAAVIITWFIHYRRRKEDKDDQRDTENRLLESVSGLVGYTNGNGEYVVFDNSVLIQQYKDSLSYNHARYTALQHDFAKMETRYTALAVYARNLFVKPKRELMENNHEMPKDLQSDINRLANDHAAEKNELHDKLAQLERSCRQMEIENRALQEQVNMRTATDDEKIAIINKWKEENTILRDKVADQEYLQDLVEEKKAQLGFLQNQLEQRIKNLYQSEHQRLQTVAELKQFKEESEAMKNDVDAMKNELLIKQEHIDKTQVLICEKEERLAEQQQLLNGKLEQLNNLENLLKETKEQQQLSSSTLNDSKNLVDSLQQQLSDEQLRNTMLEQRLSTNKQLIRKLYKEFETVIAENDVSPVIPMSKNYNRETEEII